MWSMVWLYHFFIFPNIPSAHLLTTFPLPQSIFQLINAHESPLAALQVTNDGTLLVTASERGTVLRLFETGLVKRGHGVGGSRDATEDTTGKPIREFRRGVERATVTCLSFSLDNSWVACASDHGTVHVFRCWENENAESTPASFASSKRRNLQIQ